MSEWSGDGTTLRKAQEVRRGDRILVDGKWLEVIRVNPTDTAEGFLQVLCLNGKTLHYLPDEEVMTDR